MTDQKRVKIFVGVFFIFLISFASATTINIDPIILSSSIDEVQLSFTGLPAGNTSLGLSSNIQSYAHLQFEYVSPSESYTKIYLDSVPSSDLTGYLFYGTGSAEVRILSDYVPPTDLIVFPTSKVVTVKQGSSKTQNILITVPASYPRPVTIQSVDFNPGTETILFGDLNLGKVQPGNSIQIPIVFSGEDAQTGTYQTQLSIFATDSEGQVPLPQISLTLQVTAGVSPVTGDTFSTPPTCSLSATTLNLNNTYSFTCSGVVSNLDIDIPSSEYWVGKSVEESSGIYRYTFMPIKYGETEFKADFKYNGASIFTPFKQEIRISSAGSVVEGTTLKLIFTPKLDQSTGEEESFLIQLVDNKTGSLVTNPIILVDALEINKTGEYSFEYGFLPNKDYEIRGKAPGYEDIVKTINIKPQKIEIRISPGVGDTSTMFNVTTSVKNATIKIGEDSYSDSYYGVLPGGIVKITAIKDGYKTEVINFTVSDKPRIVSFSGELKRRVQQNYTLNKNASWIVYYKKNLDTPDKIELAKGNGILIQFTPSKKGVYVIEADGLNIGTYQIEGFKLSNKLLGIPAWIWFIGGFLIVFVVFIIVMRKISPGSGEESSGMEFSVGGE